MTEEHKGRLKSSGIDHGTVPDVVTSVLQPLEIHIYHAFVTCTSAGVHQGTN
jgi:hypothetical protein